MKGEERREIAEDGKRDKRKRQQGGRGKKKKKGNK